MKERARKNAHKKGARKTMGKEKGDIFIVCEFGNLPIEMDELENEKIKFCRNPKDWRCGCGG